MLDKIRNRESGDHVRLLLNISLVITEFHCQPPHESLHAVTDRLNLTGRNRETFYECRGVPQVMVSRTKLGHMHITLGSFDFTYCML